MPTALNGFANSAPVGFIRDRMASLWAVLLLIGPGIITSSVDNDAGGIATYSIAGAEFGFHMLWPLVPIAILLVVVQEMIARMAVVSGKGLSDLIRERYGVKFTFYSMILLLVANLGTTFANFAGIAAALEIFGISRYASVPLSVMFLMWLVVRGTYGSVERVFLVACLFFLAYVIAGFLVKPDWVEVGYAMAAPSIRTDTPYLVTLVAMVGTTITPWMLFYLQASIVEKGLGVKDLRAVRIDVVAGSIVLTIGAFFIVLACAATLHKAGVRIENASEAALALEPLAGPYSKWLFAFGLGAASMIAASILPLSTAYTVCEAFGWESSLDKKFSEAPQFYGLYCFVVFFSGLFILMPGLPLVPIMFVSQVLCGVALPVVLAFIFLLIRDPEVMRHYKNGPILNVVSWIALLMLTGLSVAMIVLLLTGAVRA